MREAACLQCPRCDAAIHEADKAEMNRTGVYVAPGQMVSADGEVLGEPPRSSTISLWASGLASPSVKFGERAAEYVEAARSGDLTSVQVAVNAGFGELWGPAGGEVPEWQEVARLRLPYRFRDIPDVVRWLTAGVDVQKNRLVYVIRGWGARQESWLIEHGELWGDTAHDDVWLDLVDLLQDLKRFSREVGLTTDELRTFQALGDKFNISSDQKRGALGQFATNMDQVKRRTGSLYRDLQGMNLGDLAEKLIDAPNMKKAFEEAIKALGEIQNPQTRRALAEKMLGSAEFSAVATEMRGKFSEIFKAMADELGRVSKDTERAAAQFEEHVGRIGRAAEKAKVVVLVPLLRGTVRALCRSACNFDPLSWGIGVQS